MRQTVVGVFDRHDAARRAAAQLADSGFGPDSVHISEEPGMPRAGGALTETSEPPRDEGGWFAGLRSFLAEVFGPGPEPHRHFDEYAEAVRRGGAVVKVDVEDESRIDAARSALVASGAVDIEERVAEWRRGGWSTADAAAAASAGSGSGLAASAGTPTAAAQQEAGEQTAAGAAARPAGGGVRVYPRSTGELHASGEPEPGAASQGTPAATGGVPSGEAGSPGGEEFRRHYGQYYAGTGGRYEDYEPHYRHGDALRDDARFRGMAWEEMEPEVRTDWERRHPGREWDSYKEAVRRGWERIPV
jgi:hypothetical protein